MPKRQLSVFDEVPLTGTEDVGHVLLICYGQQEFDVCQLLARILRRNTTRRPAARRARWSKYLGIDVAVRLGVF